MIRKLVALKLVRNLLIWAIVVSHLPLITVLAQGPILSPNRLDVRLNPGDCMSETVSVLIEDTMPPKLDIVFLLDVTGSMQGITQITRNIQSIADRIQEVVPDAAFALATIADYPDDDRDAEIEPWRLVQAFTDDMAVLSQATTSLKLYSSGDEEEAYLRALYETQFLPWRLDSRRIVMLFGDANAHNPDVGRDGLPNTADDLHQHDIAAQLAAGHITVLSASPQSPAFLEIMAGQTGGGFSSYSHVNEIPDTINALITQAVSRINTLNFRQINTDQVTVTWEPNNYATIQTDETLVFTMQACVSSDAPPGNYIFPLIASGDGVALEQLGLSVEVPDPQSNISGDTGTILTTTTTLTESEKAIVALTPTSAQINQPISDTAAVTATSALSSLQLPLVSNNPAVTDSSTVAISDVTMINALNTSEVTVTSEKVRTFSWTLVCIILLPFIGMLAVYLYERKIDPARRD